MHPEIAQCLRMLARLNYIMGDHGEALATQQKAVLMSERVNGIDHPYTITEYVSIGQGTLICRIILTTCIALHCHLSYMIKDSSCIVLFRQWSSFRVAEVTLQSTLPSPVGLR